MTKKWKDADSLSNLLVKKRTVADIAKGVIVMTEEVDTEEEGSFIDNIVLLHQVLHHLHLHLAVLDLHPQALVHQILRVEEIRRIRDDYS